ncbi:hypothetical protein LSH36_564g00006 [Paralvinella palmiformis]|uniref:Cilia- and flagella-associated protein HOATZ n=1 Tax=Paralvinella palmiformis TaxID=53620 RepID=A0AAD9MVQ4_9ANNE|nr:hypothetical protein LSH36_564g00006 [Paralvinella palmiformis]
MATKIESFGQSKDITVFCDSRDDDIAYAKTFWQSMQLMPPMESRLVSSNIRQRLKVAPPGHQGINTLYTQQEESPELISFLARAHAQQKADEAKRLQKFVKLREEDLKLLQKHRMLRQEKEKIANHRGVEQEMSMPTNNSRDRDENYKEIQESMKEIEEFDQMLGHRNAESVTD